MMRNMLTTFGPLFLAAVIACGHDVSGHEADQIALLRREVPTDASLQHHDHQDAQARHKIERQAQWAERIDRHDVKRHETGFDTISNKTGETPLEAIMEAWDSINLKAAKKKDADEACKTAFAAGEVQKMTYPGGVTWTKLPGQTAREGHACVKAARLALESGIMSEHALAARIENAGKLNVPADKKQLFEKMLLKTQALRSLSWTKPAVDMKMKSETNKTKVYNRYMNVLASAVSKYTSVNDIVGKVTNAEDAGMFVFLEGMVDVGSMTDAVGESGVFDLIGPIGLMQTGADLFTQGKGLYDMIKSGDASNCEVMLAGVKVLITTASCVAQTSSLLTDGGSVMGTMAKAGAKRLNNDVDSMSFLCNPQDEGVKGIAAAIAAKGQQTLETVLAETLKDSFDLSDEQAEYTSSITAGLVVENIAIGSEVKMILDAGADAAAGNTQSQTMFQDAMKQVKSLPAIGDLTIRLGSDVTA